MGGGRVHKHMFQGKHRRSEGAQACKPSAHADVPETPSNSLQRRASPLPTPPPNPLRRLWPASHPSIHLAIDSDELTSDPSALLPHDSSASVQNPPDPLFAHLCNHPPPHTSIDIRCADAGHVSDRSAAQSLGGNCQFGLVWLVLL